MRFLVITRPKHIVPPEMTAALMDAMGPWQSKYAEQIEQAWGFAGTGGGGGIANVDSLEELDAVMAEFPFGPLSDIEIIPLVDLDGALQRAKQAAQAMAAGGGG
ncbi:MAG: DUF3303 family protein [Anaerolineae bacterium]